MMHAFEIPTHKSIKTTCRKVDFFDWEDDIPLEYSWTSSDMLDPLEQYVPFDLVAFYSLRKQFKRLILI